MLRLPRLILLGILGLGGSAAATAPGVIRHRIQTAVRDRCEAQGGLRCRPGRIRLALDGVFLEDLQIQSRTGLVRVRVARVAAPLNWARVLFGQPQPIEIRASQIQVDLRGSLAALRSELDIQRRPRAGRSLKRFTLQRLDLRQIHVHASAALGTASLEGELREAQVSWERGQNASLQWSSGHVAMGTVNRVETGNCLVVGSIAQQWTLDCSGFDASLDSERIVADLRSIEAFRSPRVVSQPTPGSETDSPETVAPTLDFRAHDGRLRVRHSTTLLAEITPVDATAHFNAQTLHDAEVKFGDSGASGPSLDVRYTQLQRSWVLNVEAGSLPLRELAPWVPGVPWHDVERGVAHTSVRVTPSESPSVIAVDGSVALQRFGVNHRMISHEPLDGLDFEVHGRTLVDFDHNRLASTGLDIRLNGIPFTVAGWAERAGERLSLDTSVQMSDVGCDAIRRSFPATAVGPVQSFVFAGTLGADLHVAVDTNSPQASVFDFSVRDGCQVARDGMAGSLRRFSGPFVQRVEEPGGLIRAFVTGPGSPAWVPLAEISPLVAGAVITREDGAFYRHHGFSPDEIRGAFVRNVTARRFAYGASTITMQLVKNVFLAREKTLVRKLQEVALTWWLEQSLDKDSILELYLNVVEFGPGIYGIGPASRFFFAREPRELTPLQAIYLSTLLPAPVPRFVNFERGAVSGETLARLRHIARSMLVNHRLTDEEFAAAMTENLTFRPRASAVPGAVTLNLDPNATDEDAARLVETLRPPPIRLAREGVAEDPELAPEPVEEPTHFIPRN